MCRTREWSFADALDEVVTRRGRFTGRRLGPPSAGKVGAVHRVEEWVVLRGGNWAKRHEYDAAPQMVLGDTVGRAGFS
jgi:hypothetical protein